jgi:hypothetical protein
MKNKVGLYVGQKVRIVGNRGMHKWENGDVVTIATLNPSNPESVQCTDKLDGWQWYVKLADIEPVELEKAVGDVFTVLRRDNGHHFTLGERITYLGNDRFVNDKGEKWYLHDNEIAPVKNVTRVTLTRREVETIYELLNQTDDEEISVFDPITHAPTYPLFHKFKALKGEMN